MRVIVTTILLVFLSIAEILSAKTDIPFKDTIVNQKVYIELIDNAKKTTVDKTIEYVKDFIVPFLTIIGMIIGFPILKRKLTENHITAALNKIQETNRTVSKECQKLIDEYTPCTYSNDTITKKDLESLFLKIKEVYYLSLDANSDSSTFLYLLKNTLQKTLKHFDNKKNSIMNSREPFGLTIEILEQTIFYCTQVVKIPKSTKTFQKSIINERIKDFVTFSDVSKYKHFNIGIVDDPKSAHFTFFYNRINLCGALIKRAAFQTIGNIHPILRIMYLNEIYAPAILTMPNEFPIFGDDKFQLYLIGIRFSSQFSANEKLPKKLVNLTYTNPSDFSLFVENLKFEGLKNKFTDTFMPNNIVDLNRTKKMVHEDFETITVTFDQAYLTDIYNKYKRQLKKKLNEK